MYLRAKDFGIWVKLWDVLYIYAPTRNHLKKKNLSLDYKNSI